MSEDRDRPAWIQAAGTPDAAAREPARCAIEARGMIAITGSDAADFLHSQFSSNLRECEPGRCLLTSYSDARGRLLAVPRVFVDEDRFLLELPRDRVDAVAAQLRRYVLRARVAIDDLSAELTGFGLVGAGVAARLEQHLGRELPRPGRWLAPAAGAVLAPLAGPIPRWRVIGPAASLEETWRRFDDFPTAPASLWDVLDIESGLPAIHEPTAARFVAQMVNLDRLDALDFRKGCYPGQEVIARTRYLGRIKRRMFPVHAPTAARPPAPGEAVVDAVSGDAVGEVVRAAPLPGRGALALAVLRLDAIDAGLALADGTALARGDPPYPLDEAA